MAHIRQSGPYSALGFQVKVLDTFHVFPSSLRSGQSDAGWGSWLVERSSLLLCFFVTLKPRVEGYTKSMSLRYEAASEPLYISVK